MNFKNIYISIYVYNSEMIINQEILMGLGIVVVIYLLSKFLFRTSKVDDDYKRVYDDVLTSKEYKVKGQYDK